MKKLIKISLIIIAIGIVLGCLGFAIIGGDFKSIAIQKCKDEEFYYEGDVNEIYINSNSTPVRIEKSTDGVNRVYFHTPEKVVNSFSVEDGKMTVNSESANNSFNFLSLFDLPFITVKLNEKEYDKIALKLSSGSVNIDNISAVNLSVNVSSGSVTLTDVTTNENMSIETTSGSVKLINVLAGKNLSVNVSSGSVKLTNVTTNENTSVKTTSGSVKLINVLAGKNLSVNTSSGKVVLDKVDGDYIEIETSSGSVKGTVLTEKTFIAKAESGSVNVPQTVSDKICKIKTSSGSIKIEYA